MSKRKSMRKRRKERKERNKLKNTLKGGRKMIAKTIKLALIALILTVSTTTQSVATPYYEKFENGIAKSSYPTNKWSLFAISLTAKNSEEAILKNDNAGTFQNTEEYFLISASLEKRLQHCISNYLYAEVYNENTLIGTLDAASSTSEWIVSATEGNHEFSLIAGYKSCCGKIFLDKISIDVNSTSVPEPSAMLLFGMGLLGFARIVRKRKF